MGKDIGYESSINEGTKKTRGIFLDMSNVKRMELPCDIFTKMLNLKFLKFYNCSEWCEKDCRLQLPGGLDYFPDELVYLHWQGYPLEYLPMNFDLEKLVVLNLRYSNIEQLWKEEKETGELRWVDLSYSKKLLNLSGLLKAQKLERLDLECCESLAECSSIQEMESLVTLNLRDCLELKSLPEETNLKSLKTLILSGCSKLMNFPTISENIESLYLDGTAVERVPESIGFLRNLAVLNLKKCCSLMSLPDNFCKLKSLKKLILSGCSRLESFPDINEDMGSLEILLMDETAINQIPRKMYMSSLKMFSFGGSKVQDLTCLELLPFSGCSGLSEMYLTDCNLYTLPDNFSCCLSFLQSLCLSRNNMENLPGSIKKLHHLKSLYLKHCENLISLPVLPSNLQYMDAHGCTSLETVAKPMTLIVVAERTHSTFVFTDCFKLNQDAQENIMAHTQLKSQILVNASLQRNHKGLVLEPLSSVSFPGNDLPLWFRHQRMGSSMEIDLPPHWCDNKFIGLSLCVVVSFKNYEDKTSRFSVICKCEFKLDNDDRISFTCRLGGWKEQCGSSSLKEEPRRLNSDHVFISHNSCFHAKKEHDLNRCCNTTASFKFYVIDGVDCCEVVKCGMSLLYAPDENDYMLKELQESNLEKATVSSGKETDLNATAIDHEAVLSKRGRVYLQEEELLNGKRLRSSNKV
ncbi:LRR-like disease resistance protein [Raphanus sativus]|nr:LRR-like disease resistance protein [Raphanus sativus]